MQSILQYKLGFVVKCDDPDPCEQKLDTTDLGPIPQPWVQSKPPS